MIRRNQTKDLNLIDDYTDMLDGTNWQVWERKGSYYKSRNWNNELYKTDYFWLRSETKEKIN